MKAALARAGYSWLLRLLTPAYFARLWWRGAHEPAVPRAPGTSAWACSTAGDGARPGVDPCRVAGRDARRRKTC
jgi:hypothetical protein